MARSVAPRGAASVVTLAALGLLTGLSFAATASERVDLPMPEESDLRRVYCVGMAAGETNFSLRIWCRPPPDVDEEVFTRLGALGSCLETPGELPISVDDSPDAALVAALEEIRTELDSLHAQLVPAHVGDENYSDGYSPGLESELQEIVEEKLHQMGVFDLLRSAYVREFARADSCADRFARWMNDRRQPPPPGRRWERIVDVCAGPPDDLAAHVVLHLRQPAAAESHVEAVRTLSRSPAFKRCLVEILRSRPELRARILALGGDSSAKEYAEVRREAHRLWGSAGIGRIVNQVAEDPASLDQVLPELDGCAGSGAAAPELPKRLLDGIYEVVMFSGDTAFSLGVVFDPPPEIDPEAFRLAGAIAMCLERPHDLPVAVAHGADADFVVRLERVRARLAELTTELDPLHRGDPDYDGSFSQGLQDHLQRRIVPALWKQGVLERVAESYHSARRDPDSCAVRLAEFVAASDVPADPREHWRQVIDVCTGPADDLSRHVVYRFDAAGVRPETRSAVRRLAGRPGFTSCLVDILAGEPALAERVRAFNGSTSYREATDLRTAVKDRWESFGLRDVIEEVRATGTTGAAFERLRGRCPSLLAPASPQR